MESDDDELAADPRAAEFLESETNAWIDIPCYDAHPKKHNLSGFASPIISWIKWEPWAPYVAEMISTSRSILRKTIPNINDVHRLNFELIDIVTSDEGAIIEGSFKRTTPAQREAFFYKSFIRKIESVTRGPWFETSEVDYLRYQMEHLALAGAHIADWAAGNGEKLLRLHAQHAAERSAEERRAKGKRSNIERAILQLTQTKGDREIPGIIESRGLSSARYARTILREMREKEKRN